MDKQTQDSFIVGKSKFPQCEVPKCFYAAVAKTTKCKKHGDMV